MPRTDVIKCVFVSDSGMTALMTYFLCNLWEKHYVIFIITWHCSLGGNFLADALRYLSWPALSRSWHLGNEPSSRLLTTLHHIHICFPEQGGNMVTTMGWGFSDFRHLFCFTQLINKQRVLMHRHQGWNVRHGLCHIYMRYLYIYISCL